MNAYENKAHELANWLETGEIEEIDIKESANMLRQQADRIVELEKEITRLIGAEPITYGTFTVCKNCGQQDPYTQTKPLSDDEIEKLFYDLNMESNLFDFARAIEERHGIK